MVTLVPAPIEVNAYDDSLGKAPSVERELNGVHCATAVLVARVCMVNAGMLIS